MLRARLLEPRIKPRGAEELAHLPLAEPSQEQHVRVVSLEVRTSTGECMPMQIEILFAGRTVTLSSGHGAQGVFHKSFNGQSRILDVAVVPDLAQTARLNVFILEQRFLDIHLGADNYRIASPLPLGAIHALGERSVLAITQLHASPAGGHRMRSSRLSQRLSQSFRRTASYGASALGDRSILQDPDTGLSGPMPSLLILCDPLDEFEPLYWKPAATPEANATSDSEGTPATTPSAPPLPPLVTQRFVAIVKWNHRHHVVTYDEATQRHTLATIYVAPSAAIRNLTAPQDEPRCFLTDAVVLDMLPDSTIPATSVEVVQSHAQSLTLAFVFKAQQKIFHLEFGLPPTLPVLKVMLPGTSLVALDCFATAVRLQLVLNPDNTLSLYSGHALVAMVNCSSAEGRPLRVGQVLHACQNQFSIVPLGQHTKGSVESLATLQLSGEPNDFAFDLLCLVLLCVQEQAMHTLASPTNLALLAARLAQCCGLPGLARDLQLRFQLPALGPVQVAAAKPILTEAFIEKRPPRLLRPFNAFFATSLSVFKSRTQPPGNSKLISSLADPDFDPVVDINTRQIVLHSDNDGTEVDGQVTALRFPLDQRVVEMRRCLCSSVPVTVVVPKTAELSDHELQAEQKSMLQIISMRTQALPVGRAMLTCRTLNAVPTQKLKHPPLNLSGKLRPTGTVSCVWDSINGGVALGLRVPARVTTQNVRTYEPFLPRGNETDEDTYAGFIYGLALNGYLRHLRTPSLYHLLSSGHVATIVALLLGLSASLVGTMSSNVAKALSIHIPALMPSSTSDVAVDGVIQCAAIVGLGLLYCGTKHRRSIEGESAKHIQDLRILDKLTLFVHGGRKRRNMLRAHREARNEQWMEGEQTNTVHNGPGALMALSLAFFNTNNTTVADLIRTPQTEFLVNHTTPELLMLRAVAYWLIMWNDIQPTEEWLVSLLNPEFRHFSLTRMSYGYHMSIATAIGMLGLGGGTCVFDTDAVSIACLLMAFYPIWPSTPTSNAQHLQAMRHLHMLAVRRRVLMAFDVENQRQEHVPLKLLIKRGKDQEETLEGLTPLLLPEDIKRVLSVDVLGQRFEGPQLRPKEVKWHRRSLNASGTIYVVPKSAAVPYRRHRKILEALLEHGPVGALDADQALAQTHPAEADEAIPKHNEAKCAVVEHVLALLDRAMQEGVARPATELTPLVEAASIMSRNLPVRIFKV
ncbi:uncharacterized protein MONBRDRAFT_22150 [Monosiga brevicollis MX1]|uniref:Uncharacterized protein n=1 Tax=Monosiga brevicollis TaxID=81824 RepID=A9UPQ1_MONBE|nr:uncharacterized protein MONBRDRAFT_22150 [Monosiga brevicollis MX1]EDQ92463.1 predicted protein [Monosiga brevicollis MX1]|eukprot:XP_001742225.1 hypothetical protein [Monosiga brevicollis MX1]